MRTLWRFRRNGFRDGSGRCPHSVGLRILLFVRRRKQDERRITAPYTFLGPATYQSHHGERPMSITWRLHHPMPAELFEEMKVAAG